MPKKGLAWPLSEPPTERVPFDSKKWTSKALIFFENTLDGTACPHIGVVVGICAYGNQGVPACCGKRLFSSPDPIRDHGLSLLPEASSWLYTCGNSRKARREGVGITGPGRVLVPFISFPVFLLMLEIGGKSVPLLEEGHGNINISFSPSTLF